MSGTGDRRPSVAIIGAGWAGLACALQLTRAGFKPVIYESAPEAGGRARRAKSHDAWRDNGQHLMLDGCTALTHLLSDIGVSLPRMPFAYSDGQRALSLTNRHGRSGLLLAMLGARGFSWGERWALLRALLALQRRHWQVSETMTVAQWLHAQRQPASLIAHFWEPLTLAILNTPLALAAMSRLVPVLRDTLGAGCEALAILQPTGDLSACVVEPLQRSIEMAGGVIRCSQRVTAVQPSVAGGLLIRIQSNDHDLRFDHVVLTVPPWALAHIDLPFATDTLTARFGAQPIATVYLGYDAHIHLPTPLVQLPGPTPTDARVWAMDRSLSGQPHEQGVIAISLSAQGPWAALDPATLAAHCATHLQPLLGSSALCRWHKVITVLRATPAATPTAHLREAERQPVPGLWLAGDWTHAHYPATLEAAVQSGSTVAEKIMAGNRQSH